MNLSRACILAIFLKHADNMKLYCKSTVVLDTRLPLAMYIQSGIWVIATRREMKFTVVCQDPLRNQGDVTVRAPFGVIKLNMSCRRLIVISACLLIMSKRSQLISMMLWGYYWNYVICPVSPCGTIYIHVPKTSVTRHSQAKLRG